MVKRIFFSTLVVIAACSASFSFPVKVVDESGSRFTAISAPRRIISTMPSNTEILFELGLGDRIVGVTSRCDFPKAAAKKKKIGDISLNLEEIISLNPDLMVMLGSAQKYQIEKMRSYSLPVFVIDPRNMDQLLGSIELLGKITGRSKKAEELTADMKKRIRAATVTRMSVPAPKVLVVLWANPLTTAGKGTFIDDIVTRSGAVNIGAGAGGQYPTISFETVLEQDPDFIIIAGKSYGDMRSITDDGKWSSVKAVKAKKILLIDSDIITRPSPRIVKATELISKFINGKI